MTSIIATTKLVLNIMWLSCVIAVAATITATAFVGIHAYDATTRVASLATSTFTSLRTRFSKA